MSRHDGFMDFLIEQEKAKEDRPEMMPKPAAIYEHEISRYPDKIRVSFKDGHSRVYEIVEEQPAPVILENIRIIRKWKTGYVNQPLRRRRRK